MEDFKCGIEIHQQLETNKLFCNCPSIVHDKNPDVFVTRKLRAVVGETNIIDKAASFEEKKARDVFYEGCSSSCCLVELDEEPPFPMNKEALAIVLQVAKLLNADIVDEIQVMRKIVLDGSNVSGFQRTSLVAMDGFVDTSQGKVRIPAICIEEEAAKKVKAEDNSVTYRLDRLGIPLIEIATDPDIISPEHAKETAEKIGMILRSTGKVKRGIGSIRQDVNISIKGGNRVEIKGFQDLKTIPFVIENEVKRQEALIAKGKEVVSEVRKAEADGSSSFLRPMPGAARLYPETDVLPIVPDDIKFDDIELIDDMAKRFEKDYGLMDISMQIAKSGKGSFFEKCVGLFPNIKASFIAECIISLPKEISRRDGISVDKENFFLDAFALINDEKISKDVIGNVLLSMAKGNFSLDNFKGVSDDDLKAVVSEIVSSMKDKPMGAIMGEVMKRFDGKVDGKKASQFIREALS